MHSFDLKSGAPTGAQNYSSNAALRAEPAATGEAAEFAHIMEGLVQAPEMSRQPSLVAQWMRAPVAAYDRVMESLERPAPAGMPVLQAMEFYARKQIDLNEARTLQNVVATVAKLAKKNVETVLNNK